MTASCPNCGESFLLDPSSREWVYISDEWDAKRQAVVCDMDVFSQGQMEALRDDDEYEIGFIDYAGDRGELCILVDYVGGDE